MSQTAKTTRKRRRKPGDIGALRRVLWDALVEVEGLLGEGSVDAKLRAAHALATLSGSYFKALEHCDFEARLAALEAVQEVRARTGLRRAA